ncbi:MAG TPA: hypothetical protein VMU94_17110 [Streptosporangiaceae bacterium]|nr:hypothetical protein [Streptosporangiaceae bacterium]
MSGFTAGTRDDGVGRYRRGYQVAASLLAARTSHLAAWHGIQPVVSALGIAVVVMAMATGVSLRIPALARVFGAIERVLYLVFLGWTVVVAAELIALRH